MLGFYSLILLPMCMYERKAGKKWGKGSQCIYMLTNGLMYVRTF